MPDFAAMFSILVGLAVFCLVVDLGQDYIKAGK